MVLRPLALLLAPASFTTGLLMFAAAPAPALANAVVTRCVDAGPGGLQAALQAGGAISFTCAPARIAVTETHEITRNTVLDGGDADAITLDAEGRTLTMFRLAADGITLTLSHVTVQGAKAPQPQVPAPGTLPFVDLGAAGSVVATSTRTGATITLQGVQVQNNDNPVLIYAADSTRPNRVVVRNTQFQTNTGAALALAGAGATADIDQSSFVWDALGLSVGGSATVARTPFSQNHGAAISVLSGATLDLRYSDFSGNTGADGAALTINGKAKAVTVRSANFTNNVASGQGGAISIYPYRNLTHLPPPPGAVSATLTYVTFNGNHAERGGAVDADLSDGGRLQLASALFQGNVAGGDGGGLYASGASIEVSGAIFKSNSAGARGAAAMLLPPAAARSVIANALVVGNKAPAGGGAIGGANLELQNVTVADDAGGGVGSRDLSGVPIGQFILHNTILARNRPANCLGAASRFLATGANLQFPQETSCGAIPAADPLLDTIYAPLPGSPAYGTGDLAVCSKLLVSGRDVLLQPRGLNGIVRLEPWNLLPSIGWRSGLRNNRAAISTQARVND